MKKVIFIGGLTTSIISGVMGVMTAHADTLHPTLSNNNIITLPEQSCGAGTTRYGTNCVGTSNTYGSNGGLGVVIKNPYGSGNVRSFPDPGRGKNVDGLGYTHKN